MHDFQVALTADYDWRLGEIAVLKFLTVQANLTDEKRAIQRKYTIPSLYAVWEGFIVNAFSEYIRVINEKELPCDVIHKNIFVYYIYSNPQMIQPPQNYEKRMNFVEKLMMDFRSPVILPRAIQRSSK